MNIGAVFGCHMNHIGLQPPELENEEHGSFDRILTRKSLLHQLQEELISGPIMATTMQCRLFVFYKAECSKYRGRVLTQKQPGSSRKILSWWLRVLISPEPSYVRARKESFTVELPVHLLWLYWERACFTAGPHIQSPRIDVYLVCSIKSWHADPNEYQKLNAALMS